jgi:hypothetical protein
MQLDTGHQGQKRANEQPRQTTDHEEKHRSPTRGINLRQHRPALTFIGHIARHEGGYAF